ncbi:MATE family efflux transporter [Desulfovibrio sp. OttesenSCG-928-F07]|nr:MATE family efflux transporter [Desulfovibrio sp. OttesenSCG-928-F07]
MFGFRYLKRHWNAPQGYKDILRIGLPLVASMVSSTVMQFTDRLFLSRYSLDTIAASGFAGMTSLTLLMTFQGICSYATVLAAQYVGARRPERVGPAMWQGIWCAAIFSVLLLVSCLFAKSFFGLSSHEPEIKQLEIQYFVVLTSGSSFALFGSAVSAYFFGRGITKPIMVANIVAALVNIPLDYLLIWGIGPFPEMGIIGAGVATVAGWVASLLILSLLVFNKKNDKDYYVLRGWRPEFALFKRLIHFGLPSGTQFCVEFIAQTWFLYELGNLGRIPQAASNIAFAINGLVFMPMIGLSMAASTLVGQAMGSKKPFQAERASYHTLHLAFIYMVSVAAIIVLFAGNLIDIFKGSQMVGIEDFNLVRQTGIILLYYVALYSLVDAANLIFIGALKGAGDTIMVMVTIISCVMLFLIIPLFVLRITNMVTLHSLWIIFTSYIFILALCITVRFRKRKWHKIQVIENQH